MSDRLPPGWKRIANDLRRTTSLVLSLRWEPLEQYVVVQLGGTVRGGFGSVWSGSATAVGRTAPAGEFGAYL